MVRQEKGARSIQTELHMLVTRSLVFQFQPVYSRARAISEEEEEARKWFVREEKKHRKTDALLAVFA